MNEDNRLRRSDPDEGVRRSDPVREARASRSRLSLNP
jgi:hypothetical protein